MASNFFRIKNGISLSGPSSAPQSPINGDIYYDVSQGVFKFYQAGGWVTYANGGTGNVVGPLTAIDNRVAFFDGTTGKVIKDNNISLSGNNTGDITLGAVGSTPNSDGATLTGQAIVLQPASATFPGLLTAGTQTIGGNKTFASNVNLSSGLITGQITNASLSGANATLPDTSSVLVRLTNPALFSLSGHASSGLSYIKQLVNATGAAITIRNESSSALAVDRILTGAGADIVLQNDASIWMTYDLTSSRWRVIGASSVQFTSTSSGIVPASGSTPNTFLRYDGVWVTPSGAGDVLGPSSSVNNRVAVFDGTTGKVIKDSGFTVSGNNTGDQVITLTGEVTGTGTGTFGTLITPNAVVNSKLAQIPTATFKGRISALTGNVEDLTGAQATTLLSLFTGDLGAGGQKGLVPGPAAGDTSQNKFLKANGTWATVEYGVAGLAERTQNSSRGFADGTQTVNCSIATVSNKTRVTVSGYTLQVGNNPSETVGYQTVLVNGQHIERLLTGVNDNFGAVLYSEVSGTQIDIWEITAVAPFVTPLTSDVEVRIQQTMWEAAEIDAINTDVIPLIDNMNSLGSSARRWKDVWVGPNSLHVGTNGTIGFNETTQKLQFSNNGGSSYSEMGITPVATVIFSASSTVPYGYLLCDGQAVSRTVYAALFTSIGITFGNGNGSTTFNLPNLTSAWPVAGMTFYHYIKA